MAESNLVQLNFENNSYSVCSIIFMYSVCQAFGHILMSYLVVTDLFICSFPDMILP